MDQKQVLGIIRERDSLDDIRYFLFSSTSPPAESFVTFIKHFEYQNCVIKIKRTDPILDKHEENLRRYKPCRFLINIGEGSKRLSIWLNCICEGISRKFINIKINTVSYDKDGKKFTYDFSE